ncbi:unnamed protein product, partial [Closterium sp. NIES-54]
RHVSFPHWPTPSHFQPTTSLLLSLPHPQALLHRSAPPHPPHRPSPHLARHAPPHPPPYPPLHLLRPPHFSHLPPPPSPHATG